MDAFLNQTMIALKATMMSNRPDTDETIKRILLNYGNYVSNKVLNEQSNNGSLSSAGIKDAEQTNKQKE